MSIISIVFSLLRAPCGRNRKMNCGSALRSLYTSLIKYRQHHRNNARATAEQSEFSIPSRPSSHVIQFRLRLAIIVSLRLLISAYLIISRRNERIDRDFPCVKTTLKLRPGGKEREREKGEGGKRKGGTERPGIPRCRERYTLRTRFTAVKSSPSRLTALTRFALRIIISSA